MRSKGRGSGGAARGSLVSRAWARSSSTASMAPDGVAQRRHAREEHLHRGQQAQRAEDVGAQERQRGTEGAVAPGDQAGDHHHRPDRDGLERVARERVDRLDRRLDARLAVGGHLVVAQRVGFAAGDLQVLEAAHGFADGLEARGAHDEELAAGAGEVAARGEVDGAVHRRQHAERGERQEWVERDEQRDDRDDADAGGHEVEAGAHARRDAVDLRHDGVGEGGAVAREGEGVRLRQVVGEQAGGHGGHEVGGEAELAVAREHHHRVGEEHREARAPRRRSAAGWWGCRCRSRRSTGRRSAGRARPMGSPRA